MKTETRTVTASDGEVKNASFAICPECDFDYFLIFEIEGQNHYHLQCVSCRTSYCPGGLCKGEEDEAVGA